MQQSQPALTQLLKTKTYELPQCIICEEDMIENLSVTSCGHVFHSMCISQGLEYRGQCPNCHERTSQRQLRELNYCIRVNQIEDESRIQFLESLKKADQDNYLKLIAKNAEMYTELEVEKRKVAKLNNTIREFEKDAQDFERMKKIQASANDNEDEYLKLIKERGSAEEQAKTFYEFLRIKKADLNKSKDELQRVSRELAHYKEKACSLELASQNKETPDQSSEAELRVFRNLVYPKGITQPGSQLGEENKNLGIFSNRLSVNNSNSSVRANLENLKRKSTDTAFNMKNIKLSDDFVLKNVQQKFSSFGSFN